MRGGAVFDRPERMRKRNNQTLTVHDAKVWIGREMIEHLLKAGGEAAGRVRKLQYAPCPANQDVFQFMSHANPGR